MNELAQAFDLMEKAEEEYIGDLEWKRDLLEALYLGGASLQKCGNLHNSATDRNPNWPGFLNRSRTACSERKDPSERPLGRPHAPKRAR